MSKRDLEGKTFLVTGANIGIGKATATALAARGGTVVLAARSEEKTKPVLAELRASIEGADLHFLKLDLADLAATKRAAEEYLASGRPLDALINNAGLANAPGLTKDGFEITIGTNHLGPFLFTNVLLPRLRESKQGRVVNVSSRANLRCKGLELESARRAGRSAPERLRLYGVSKLMNILHAKELARREAKTKITTYALHPGVVASDAWRSLPSFVQPVVKLFMISNEEGAATSVHCATAPELATVTGRYFVKSREATPNPLADDEKLATELWTWSERMIDEAFAAVKSAA